MILCIASHCGVKVTLVRPSASWSCVEQTKVNIGEVVQHCIAHELQPPAEVFGLTRTSHLLGKMRSGRIVYDMRDWKLRQLEDLADEIPNVHNTPSSVGTGGYLGFCAAKHHLQLAGPPVDSAVAEKDKEAGRTPHSRPPPVKSITVGAKPCNKPSRVQGTSGALRQSAEDLQRCDNGCSVSY